MNRFLDVNHKNGIYVAKASRDQNNKPNNKIDQVLKVLKDLPTNKVIKKL